MRTLLVFAACLSLTRVSAQEGAKPIGEREVAKFWGIAQSHMSWSRVEGPDFDVYYGHAKRPLRGGVGVYMGGHPSFEPVEGVAGVLGRLGTYEVRWFESHDEDGAFRKEGLVHISASQIFHVWIYGPSTSDITVLEKELTTYAVFSPKSSATSTK